MNFLRTHQFSKFYQEQDSPTSLFSFSVDADPTPDAGQESPTSTFLSDEDKVQLQSILDYLQQDILLLVKDAEPIRNPFKHMRDRLPDEVIEALVPMAYIESREIQVTRAKERLDNRSKQANLEAQRDHHKVEVENIKGRINTLNNSRPLIIAEIDRMKTRRAELLKEVQELTHSISIEEKKLEDLPSVIWQMEEDKLNHARQAINFHKQLRRIPGSADADQAEIDKADALLLRAINAIQQLLGSL